MGGAFIMHCKGMTSGTLCSTGMSVTLCPWVLTVSGCGNLWGSSAGRIHLCRGCVRTSAWGAEMPWQASLLHIKVSTHCCYLGVIAFSVMTILSENPLRCSVQVRHGTWQCWGNDSVEPEICYKVMATLVMVDEWTKIPSICTTAAPWSSVGGGFINDSFASRGS